MQQRLERNLIHIRNQKTGIDCRIAFLKQYFVSMDVSIRKIGQHSVCIEQKVRIILRYPISWSRYVHIDGHVRDFGFLCADIADLNKSINLGNDTASDSD